MRMTSTVSSLSRSRPFGGLDILVNNASKPDTMGLLTGWMDAMAVEILAPMRTTLAAFEAMRRRGGGAIVNSGSTSALGHGHKHSPWPAYDVGKMAQIGLTTTLACLRDQENIRVNCLVPAWIASPGRKEYWESLTPEQRRERGVPDTLLSLRGSCRRGFAASHGRSPNSVASWCRGTANRRSSFRRAIRAFKSWTNRESVGGLVTHHPITKTLLLGPFLLCFVNFSLNIESSSRWHSHSCAPLFAFLEPLCCSPCGASRFMRRPSASAIFTATSICSMTARCW